MKDNKSPFGGDQERLSWLAAALVENIQAGKVSDAMRNISELTETRDRKLYQEVGRLTRTLHESIRNFNIESGSESQQEELSMISGASDRLAYVVDLTDSAANRTMDLVEESIPLATEMKTEAHDLKVSWEKLRRRGVQPTEFRQLYKQVDVFFQRLSVSSDKLSGNLSAILLAQDFQDLTGQVIGKVTALVREVEENLVNLVAMAGNVDRITGIEHDLDAVQEDPLKGLGPQIDTTNSEVVSSQDDVDDLLSSLGF